MAGNGLRARALCITGISVLQQHLLQHLKTEGL